MMGRSIQILLALLAVVGSGGIVHIIAILLLPWLAPNDAFARIARFAALDQITPLRAASLPDDRTPFRDPAVASSICRYDLQQGPLRVVAVVNREASIALSFHSRYGLPFYGLTDHSSTEGKLDVLLLTATQLEQAEAQDPEDEPLHEVRVVSPETEGFVRFDALPRIGGYAIAEQALRSVSCKIERNF